MSEQCERTSERTSEWSSTYASILVCSAPLWDGGKPFEMAATECKTGDARLE